MTNNETVLRLITVTFTNTFTLTALSGCPKSIFNVPMALMIANIDWIVLL